MRRPWRPQTCRSSGWTQPRPCVAGHSSDLATTSTSSTRQTPGSAPRPGPTRRTCDSPGHAERRSWRDAGSRRSDPTARASRSPPAGRRYRAARAIVTADAWTNDLLEPLGHAVAARRDPRAGRVLRAGRSGAVRDRPVSVLDLVRRPVVLWVPDLWRGGPKVAEDIGGQPVTADRRTFEPDEPALVRLRSFVHGDAPRHRPVHPPDQDLPVHAHARPRFRDRCRSRPSQRAGRTRGRARVQVRLVDRPDVVRAGDRAAPRPSTWRRSGWTAPTSPTADAPRAWQPGAPFEVVGG